MVQTGKTQYHHWKPWHFKKLKTIRTNPEMAGIAISILAELQKESEQPIAQVCGPLTTGGFHSFEANLDMIGKGIDFLAERGKTVFDQRPFEFPIKRMGKKKEKKRARSGYPMALLEEFYLPILESGLIKELHFLPNWESSIGACWERTQGERLSISCLDFPQDWHLQKTDVYFGKPMPALLKMG